MSNRLRRLLRTLMYAMLSRISEKIRMRIYRKYLIDLPKNYASRLPDGVSFEIARSKAELEAAFELARLSYVEAGFVKPEDRSLHITVHHALPTCSTIVVKYWGQIVGTVTLFRDGPVGLPMEKEFNLARFRKPGRRIAEVAALAVDKRFRRQRGGQVFLPMLVFLQHYAREYFGVDDLVFNVYPHHADFYTAIFGAISIPQLEIKNYMGAPAKALFADLHTVFEKLLLGYAEIGQDAELRRVLRADRHLFRFPDKIYKTLHEPVMSAQTMHHFFRERTHLFDNLNFFERRALLVSYASTEHRRVIDPLGTSEIFNRAPRFDSKIEACFCYDLKQGMLAVQVLDVSIKGLKVQIDRGLDVVKSDTLYTMRVKVGDFQLSELKVRPTWRQIFKNHSNDAIDGESALLGLEIVESDSCWRDYISHLSSERENNAA